ncbi:MAG: Gfo/Idh/MocA family oxidoreductase [Phycisphaerae bacterium]|nr:Gfo/Idh/MocA family oxidoreductase [Phycisphaerae bacterium]
MSKVRVAVIGGGKMGALHSRIYSQMDQVDLVGIVDSDLSKAQKLTAQYGGTAYSDPGAIINKVDAVTLSVPTEFHAEVAEPFLTKGIAILVEKPLADTLENARTMLQLASENKGILQVGYSERFNPIGQAMSRLNITPRFIESNRISPFTFRSTDVGVVLDLMIHDIDIILSLVKSPIINLHAVGVNVVGEHEDIANVRLCFENGCVANMTASRIALKTERKIRIFSEDAYLNLDYLKKEGTSISKAANIDMLKTVRQMFDGDGQLNISNASWADQVKVETLDIDDKEPLRLEQEAFIQAVMDGSRPEVSGEDAVAAMELAERIVANIAEHRWENTDSKTFSAQQLK